MNKTYKRFASIMMVLVVMVVSMVPYAAGAELTVSENTVDQYLLASSNAIVSTKGANLYTELHDILIERNVTVRDNTLVELIALGSKDALALVATNVDGDLVTKNIFMGLDENGQLISANTATTRDLSGGFAIIDPFDDSFVLDFTISFKARGYGGYAIGAVQPQSAMFIYYDNSNLYSISKITTTYVCSGAKGYFDSNGSFVSLTGPLEHYTHEITVSKTNPNRNAYYSASNPMNTYYILINGAAAGGQTGAHILEYTIEGVRNSNGRSVNVTDIIEITQLIP